MAPTFETKYGRLELGPFLLRETFRAIGIVLLLIALWLSADVIPHLIHRQQAADAANRAAGVMDTPPYAAGAFFVGLGATVVLFAAAMFFQSAYLITRYESY